MAKLRQRSTSRERGASARKPAEVEPGAKNQGPNEVPISKLNVQKISWIGINDVAELPKCNHET